MKLAFGIATFLRRKARYCPGAVVNTFQKGNIPDAMPEYQLKEGDNLIDILVTQKWQVRAGKSAVC